MYGDAGSDNKESQVIHQFLKSQIYWLYKSHQYNLEALGLSRSLIPTPFTKCSSRKFVSFFEKNALVNHIQVHELDGKQIDPKIAFPKKAQPKVGSLTESVAFWPNNMPPFYSNLDGC